MPVSESAELDPSRIYLIARGQARDVTGRFRQVATISRRQVT